MLCQHKLQITWADFIKMPHSRVNKFLEVGKEYNKLLEERMK